MALKKEYIILLAIIIALSAYIVLQKKNKTHYSLPEIDTISKESISKITLMKTTSEITLAREDDGWFIEPQHFPADEGKVEHMLNALSKLRLTALVSESGNYSLYELDDEQRIDVEVFHGDTLLLTMGIGKPASSFRHTFIRINNDHRVYHAADNLKNIFDKTLSGLRDKGVLKFDEQIAEVLLRKGNDTLKIVRTEAPVSVDPDQKPTGAPQDSLTTWRTDDEQAVKNEEVDSMLSTLKNLTCDEFIEDAKKEDFTEPVYSILLKGLKEYSISFFEKTDGKHPAVSSENDYPFFLSDWKQEKIMKEFGDLTVSEKER